jgi:predicted dehydrogenase
MAKSEGRKTVRVGVIGAGGIARAAHIPGYQACDGVEVAAVADVNEAAARRVAEEFHIPQVFTDYRDLLALGTLDAVSVCTPNFMHKEPTVAALRAGKHVLCEKPIARTAAEGRAMVAAARKSGRHLMVALQWRFRPEAQTLKRHIAAGDLGEIYYAHAQALRRRGIPGWGDFVDKEKAGGGPLIDIGVHILDVTLWLMGHPKPTSVLGATYAKFGHRQGVVGLMGQWDVKRFSVEDFAVGMVRFANGASLLLEASFAANLKDNVFTTHVYGTEGGANLLPLEIFAERHGAVTDTAFLKLPKVQAHAAEVAAFVEAVRTGGPVPIPGEEALLATEILDAIYASSASGREVRLRDGAKR